MWCKGTCSGRKKGVAVDLREMEERSCGLALLILNLRGGEREAA